MPEWTDRADKKNTGTRSAFFLRHHRTCSAHGQNIQFVKIAFKVSISTTILFQLLLSPLLWFKKK
jgi:hypothetical protein